FEPLLEIEPVPQNQPALISFPSGSTAQPKGIVRTHGFLIAQHRILSRSLDLKAGERELVSLPVFVLANLASAVTSILPNVDLRKPAEIDPLPVIEQIQQARATRITASPALLETIVRRCTEDRIQLRSVTEVFTGGGPVFPRFTQALKVVAPQASIHILYGSSEAEPIAHIRASEWSQED